MQERCYRASAFYFRQIAATSAAAVPPELVVILPVNPFVSPAITGSACNQAASLVPGFVKAKAPGESEWISPSICGYPRLSGAVISQ
jgi:hypothetical protein